MKNLMSNLKGMNYKEFAVNHAEKIILGFIALFVAFAILTSAWTTEKRTPLELTQKVDKSESLVANSQWPEEKRKEFLKKDDLWENANMLMSNSVEVTPYEFSTPLSTPLYAKKERAKEVDWLPVEQLVADYGRFIMMVRPPNEMLQNGIDGIGHPLVVKADLAEDGNGVNVHTLGSELFPQLCHDVVGKFLFLVEDVQNVHFTGKGIERIPDAIPHEALGDDLCLLPNPELSSAGRNPNADGPEIPCSAIGFTPDTITAEGQG